MKANPPPQPTQRANQRHILSRADKEKLMVIFESGNSYPTLELRCSLASICNFYMSISILLEYFLKLLISHVTSLHLLNIRMG